MYESIDAWQHLTLAEILPGNYSGAPSHMDGNTVFDIPKTQIEGSHWWLQDFNIGNTGQYYFGNVLHTANPSTGYWCGGSPLWLILAVEKKYDDLLPRGGSVMLGGVCGTHTACASSGKYIKANAEVGDAICTMHFLLE